MALATLQPKARGGAHRTRHVQLHIPKGMWEPLPMERRLRADTIERTRGILRGSRTDPVAWQRRIRSQGSQRLREQDRLWSKPKKRRRGQQH